MSRNVGLTLEALGDPWSLIVICDLMFGNRRLIDRPKRLEKPDWYPVATIGPYAGEPARLCGALRKKLRSGDGTFTRDQVRAFAQRVEVVSWTEVRIRGLRSELLQTPTAASGVEGGGAGRSCL